MRTLKPEQIQIIPSLRSHYGIKILAVETTGTNFLILRGDAFRIHKDVARPCVVCNQLTNLEHKGYKIFVCAEKCFHKYEKDRIEFIEDICEL